MWEDTWGSFKHTSLSVKVTAARRQGTGWGETGAGTALGSNSLLMAI